jgi:nucleoside-diphosphate-sugar epimerase
MGIDRRSFPSLSRRRERPDEHPRKPRKAVMTVILTGSTGSLGAYLLDRLLVNPKVERIICLNRSKDAQQRQIENHLSRGLPTVFDPARVEFWQCDLSAPAFGLKAEDYTHLTSNVTHVLHNAWSVDFNKHLSSFEPNIRGVRRLVELACNSTYDATIFFVSSMSVVANWGTVAGALAKVPETIIEDWRVAKWAMDNRSLSVSGFLRKQRKSVASLPPSAEWDRLQDQFCTA